MKNDIVIIGSGGFAKEVRMLIRHINQAEEVWNFLGYIDNDLGTKIGDDVVFNNDSWLQSVDKEIFAIIGIGNPSVKKKIADRLSTNNNIKFPNLIHPNATGDWPRISFGKGNVVCSSCCFTTDITIGDFNAFNLCTTLGHDAVVGDYNVINPSTNLSGKVSIGDENLIGTNTAVLEDINISSNVIIGAGSTVIRNIEGAGTYVGSPVKKIK